jgi:solute carrier family 45 protein 1/2/4
LTIGFAVLGFYIMDFSINAVQACLRALVIDLAPTRQQSQASAWASRMLGFGNVMGYFVGFLNLVALFPGMGSTQLEVLYNVGLIVFISCIAWTCLFSWEKQHIPTIDEHPKPWYTALNDLFYMLLHLPDPVQRICNAQFFAWMAWFPFLFYR